ncbi:23893_t:CDS:2 [Gigaspora margarita]|uniref:23893_t:CDS:1 n=1 Tax=Gigaspora margarita TaxID=4874 RepID=A0ABN7V6U5_GIGMA|nr:23893_t:CDS:2 [Gigaspora margarita]
MKDKNKVSTNSSSDDRTKFGGPPLQVESSPPDGKSPSDDRMIVPPSHFQHRPPSDDRMDAWVYAVDSELNFEQAVIIFKESLEQLNQFASTPNPIKAFCHNYLEWLKSRAGITIIQECRKYFGATKYQRQSAVLNDTVEVAQLRPSDALLSPDPLSPLITIQLSDATDKTPPQTPRELTHLLNTPNKPKELETEIGTELTKELSSIRDRNPVVWNSDLEKYINATLKESGENFKNAVRNKNYKDIDEGFRLYCEKVLIDFYNLVDVDPNIDRKIGERKHIVYQVSALFKFYERTFLTLDIDWIESHSRPAKLLKSESNSGIVLVDTKVTRFSGGLDVWHLEVAGPPYNAPNKHILGDSKKTIQTDILNLITILREHLDCDINLATRIKVFSMLSISK